MPVEIIKEIHDLRIHGLDDLLDEDRLNLLYRTLERHPTLPEVVLFGIESGEHCGYVSSKRALREFLIQPGLTEGPNVKQGVGEDAGIIYFDTIDGENHYLVLAHESHNHPSAVNPYQGAATGIGGIIRDVFCMGGKLIAVLDPLRFGSPYGNKRRETRFIANGVAAGIGGYANPYGVPNLGGDIVFDKCYNENPLVNVVALGIATESDIIHSKCPAERRGPYKMILVGKPTDNSGYLGATFASVELDVAKENLGAVQVAEPFLKEVLSEAGRDVMEMLKEEGYNLSRDIGYKDLGGGGLFCGSSEVGKGISGIAVDFDQVHTSMPNLATEEIGAGETQERYIWVVPESVVDDVLRIYNEVWDLPGIYEGARASVIGEVTEDGKYVVKYRGETVIDVPLDFVVEGISYDREFKPPKRNFREPNIREPENLGRDLLRMLRNPNLACKEAIFTTYDTTVQANTIIAPGEADAGLLRVKGSRKGIAGSTDGNPFYGRINPYVGGASAVAEAARNVAAIGATPQAITDCLNYGSPDNPSVMWQLREGVRGIADASRGIGLKGTDSHLPIVSGNVSLYNQSFNRQTIKSDPIFPSPTIFCAGIIDDYSKAVTLQLKHPGDRIYLVGERFDELGGSEYYRTIHRRVGANVPEVRFEYERAMIYAIIDAINNGNANAVHDISNGGFLTTAAEMAMGGRARGKYGMEIDLQQMKEDLPNHKKLFSESSGFVVEVPQGQASYFEKIMSGYGINPAYVGDVIGKPRLVAYSNSTALDLSLDDMKSAWTSGLPRALR